LYRRQGFFYLQAFKILPSSSKEVPKMTTQQEALDALKNNGNYLLSGGAGVGKSYVIDKFHNTTTKNVALTATTGVAALNISGETVNRFLSLGISSRPFDLPKLFGTWDKIRKSSMVWDKNRMAVMKKLDAIVIDEVSMLRRDQFELIDALLSHIRKDSRPFGGVQILAVGDLLQLGPVITDQDLKNYPDLKDPYCFQSDSWKFGAFETLNLTQNYRQSSGEFLNALNEIRLGQVSDITNDLLESRVGVKLETDLTPVKLYSLNRMVEQENLRKLEDLTDEKTHAKAIFTGKEFDVEQLKKDCPAEEMLSFCVGAQVMMLVNDVEGKFVNGTMGIIENVKPVKIRLSTGKTVEVEPYTWEKTKHEVKGNKVASKVVAEMVQYPFKLSWAVSIHKSQSITLDFVELDLGSIFAAGQAYTGLSRVRTLEGLKLLGYNRKSIKADPRVLKFYGYE
jgi:ATP-dependent exoDNAse (exonuclease V) alpha subunit